MDVRLNVQITKIVREQVGGKWKVHVTYTEPGTPYRMLFRHVLPLDQLHTCLLGLLLWPMQI